MTAKDDNIVMTSRHDKKIMYLIGGVILLSVFLIGLGAGNMHSRNLQSNRLGFGGSGMMTRHMGDRTFMGARGGTINSSDRVNGTVTAVNGATLTVAGHGSSYQVLTNSSTQYQNGSTPKVNDTVLVFGTTNGGVLTATQIVINP